MDLNQLKEFARANGILLHSQISECIIRSDITNTTDPLSSVKYGPDQLGRQTALHAGIDPVNFTRRAFLNRMRAVLRNLGIPERFLDDSAILSAIGALVEEKRLPLTEDLQFKQVDVNLFAMTGENFRRLVRMNIRREDYIAWGGHVSGVWSQILLSQPLNQLLALALILPSKGSYVPTRIGVLDYLYNYHDVPQIKEYFEQLHKLDYPDREELIFEAEQQNIIIPSILSQDQLTIPPSPNEELYLRTVIYHPDQLSRLFPTVVDLDPIDRTHVELLRAIHSDPSFRMTREQLYQMVISGDSRILQISPQVWYEVTGWKGVYPINEYPFQIRIQAPGFGIISDSRLCRTNRDSFYDPFRDFAITLGTFLDFICYSPEELEASFIVTPELVSFRRPDRPHWAFSLDEIYELVEVLSSEFLTPYQDRIGPLSEKINRGLSQVITIDPQEVSQRFESIPENERRLMARLFQNLFTAGMYQRTWNGVGPYPMLTSDTRGLCSADIEIRMTPILNDIEDTLGLMNISRSLVYRLSMVEYREGQWIQLTDQLFGFLDQLRSGNYCIGSGSSIMIYTGYFYLSILGVDIPGFDLSRFEPESTHR